MTDQKRTKGRQKGDILPQAWISGPDPVRHAQHIAWRQQKNQCQWRGEGWEIDFDDWILIWGLNWEKRGRKPDQMCMTRIDIEKGWVNENIKIVTRSELLSQQAKDKCLNRWGNKTRTPEELKKYEKNKEYQATYRAKLLRIARGEE